MDLRKGSKTIICTSCGLPAFECPHFLEQDKLNMYLEILDTFISHKPKTNWNLELKKLVEEGS